MFKAISHFEQLRKDALDKPVKTYRDMIDKSNFIAKINWAIHMLRIAETSLIAENTGETEHVE